MISTGMYHADVMKSKLFFTIKGRNKHVRYRRSKNDSLCKAIPLQDDEIFIGKQIIEDYGIRNGSNFPLNLSLTHFDKHLEKISEMAEIGFKITNKMARKTFASMYYFDRELPVHFIQVLLGHKDVKDTYHYLRIDDDDIADEIVRRLGLKSSIEK
jgi:integrase